MNKITGILIVFLLTLNVSASSIYGLDEKEKNDATTCLKLLHNLDFEQINRVPNDFRKIYSEKKLERVLLHNFVEELFFEDSLIENSVIISASLLVNGKALSFKNTVISNVTLAGDVSNVDFSGACLVNVSLPSKTSFLDYIRIKRQVKFSKNIEFNDDIYKNY